MPIKPLRLKKHEDRRLRHGHLWVYSNEIDTQQTPLKSFQPGEEVLIEGHDGTPIGIGYINPHSLIAARLCTRNPHESLTTDFFIKRLKNAYLLRQQLFSKPFYRLVFGESDELPGLVMDRFDDILVVQQNTIGMESRKVAILESIKEVLPEINAVLFKNDSSSRKQEGLPEIVETGFGTVPDIIQLEENGVHFKAPLYKGQKTGWFYDHRLNRSRMAPYVRDKTVLDVFSYLGGWGVTAATLGASKVTCVDASSLSTEFIPQNAALNQVQDKVNVIEEDAFTALKQLQQTQTTFDVIVLDPPAFVKKLKNKKEGLLAYQRINESALKLLKPNGILISASCSMHVSAEDMADFLKRASFRAQSPLQLLEEGHQAPDHPRHLHIPETNYLKMLITRKL